MKKLVTLFLFALLSLLFATNAIRAATIYKCKNEEGVYIYQKSACNGNNDTVNSWTPKETAQPQDSVSEQDESEKNESPVTMKLKQGISGHYATEGKINDKSLNFVVDTGASMVTLPESIAHDALIYCDDKIKMETANGVVDSCTATIGKLEFGPFIIKDVPAAIQPNLSQPLLGMNILQHFKIEQNTGEMQISILKKPKNQAN
ncbi:MAG: retroviral-like aspartic protease family protein [Methylococcaceae bacterium]|nr:retroviral-like aspartic protease family protein [Methylococcaceae bacterium]